MNKEAELQKLRDIGFTEFQAKHILFFDHRRSVLKSIDKLLETPLGERVDRESFFKRGKV